MESADQNVGPEPCGNIQNAFVGASAEQHSLVVFFHQKILFVAEIIRQKAILLFHTKAEAAEFIGFAAVIAGIQRKPRAERSGISGGD